MICSASGHGVYRSKSWIWNRVALGHSTADLVGRVLDLALLARCERQPELLPAHHAAGEARAARDPGFAQDHRAQARPPAGLAHHDDRLVACDLVDACAELVQW